MLSKTSSEKLNFTHDFFKRNAVTMATQVFCCIVALLLFVGMIKYRTLQVLLKIGQG